MPTLPIALASPGLVLALCLIVGLVIGVNATLVSMLHRGSGAGDGGRWGQALEGARERHRQQSAQMDALHRAVADLSAKKASPDKPNE